MLFSLSGLQKCTVFKLISWKHSFKRLNEEYEITKKKKQALDALFENGRISQATRDSFDSDINAVIAEIEKQQNDLLMKMQGKAQELESQIKTLETLLANYEIQHVVGEIDEEIYHREINLLSTGLESAKRELSMILEATSQLSPPVEEAAPETILPPEETPVEETVQNEIAEDIPVVSEETEVVAEPSPEEPIVTMETTVNEQPEIELETPVSIEPQETVEEIPQQMGYVTEVAEDVTEVAEDVTEVAEDVTEVAEDVTEVAEDVTEVAEDVTEVAEYPPQEICGASDVIESSPEISEEMPQIMDETPEITENNPENTEEMTEKPEHFWPDQEMEDETPIIEESPSLEETPEVIEDAPQELDEMPLLIEDLPEEAHPSEAPQTAHSNMDEVATEQESEAEDNAESVETEEAEDQYT
jgi:methyl-accepting chemotaxis protein